MVFFFNVECFYPSMFCVGKSTDWPVWSKHTSPGSKYFQTMGNVWPAILQNIKMQMIYWAHLCNIKTVLLCSKKLYMQTTNVIKFSTHIFMTPFALNLQLFPHYYTRRQKKLTLRSVYEILRSVNLFLSSRVQTYTTNPRVASQLKTQTYKIIVEEL